jgi:Tol biopolymer transport system component
MDLTGEGIPIAEQVGRVTNVIAFFSASASGILAYRTGGGSTRRLNWYDRQGKMLDSVGQPGDYNSLALSPDGTRVAVERRESTAEPDLWLMDSASTADGTRFTFDPGRDLTPVFSPDGNRIAFVSQRQDGNNLYQKLSNMGGNEEVLFKSSAVKYLNDWSRDARYLLFSSRGPKGDYDLWVLPATAKSGDAKPEPFLNTTFNETQGKFSLDGKWIVYVSDENGPREVYVRPFPFSEAGGKWQISSGGGVQPRWSRDSKEIFYLNGQKLMSAQVSTSPVFKANPPKTLFEAAFATSSNNLWGWDVDPTGQKFLINTQAGETTSAPITLLLNWETLLKK